MAPIDQNPSPVVTCAPCADTLCSLFLHPANTTLLLNPPSPSPSPSTSLPTLPLPIQSPTQIDLCASNGCPLASEIVQAFIPRRYRHTHHRRRFRLADLLPRLEASRQQDEPEDGVDGASPKIVLRREDRRGGADLRLLSIRVEGGREEEGGGQAVGGGYLAVLAREDDPAGRYVRARPRDADPGSVRNYELVKGWIRDCCAGHEACPGGDGEVLPTRVIDVGTGTAGDGGEVRLHLGQGEVARYVALSYCWGGPQPFWTTRETLAGRLLRLPFEDLPQTIKDAVSVTRNLDLRYLWVDSLCMVQDDPEDKVRELGRMAQIYQSAFLTISAASSWKCTLPMLFPRRPDLEGAVKLPYRCPDGTLGSIYLRPAREFDMDGGFDLQGVLTEVMINTRAWCYQERLLSPRVLSYRHDGIQWKCVTGLKSDDELKEEQLRLSNTPATGIDKLSSLFFSPHTNSSPIQISDPMKQELHADWLTKVSAYANRNLTVPSDRLPALSGVAQEFSRLLNDTYLSGLWRTHLLPSLFWYVPEHPLHRNANRMEALARCRRGPSWSWSTVDTPISYVNTSETTPLSSQVEVLAVSATPRSPLAPFGEVASGSLTLRAPLRKVRAGRVKEYFSGFGSLHWAPRRPYKMGMIHLDRGDPCQGEREWLWFLELQDEVEMRKGGGEEEEEEKERQWGPWGLLLVDAGEGVLERVGLVNFSKGLQDRRSASPTQVAEDGKRDAEEVWCWEVGEESSIQVVEIV